ncbi:MAG TPA: hypothetical protein VKE24_03055 [Candidatus Acidoferrales bacterium]|nr:hypothetical protein [Candidatus Acidoferrales bacterium]
MEPKKFLAAVVVGYIILMGLAFLIHGVWLMPVYQQYATIWRLEEAMRHKMWINWVGQLLFTVVFAWVYTRGVEDKPWVGQGIRYGLLMTLFVVIPSVCAEYVVYPIPYTLALEWMLAGAVQLLVLGVIVAGFCRKPAT